MRTYTLWLGIAALLPSVLWADATPAPAITETASATSLAEAFHSAWLRHPAHRGDALRMEALDARRAAAEAWFPEPPSVALAHRNDAFNRDQGEREWEAELALPLWLPGQKERLQESAKSQTSQYTAELAATRWRLAGEIRNAWWDALSAKNEVDLAVRKVEEAGVLLADVTRRVSAGDLAEVDRNQAAAVEQAAKAQLARAQVEWRRAQGEFLALTGLRVPTGGAEVPAPELSGFETHPEWMAARAAVAAAQAQLNEVQKLTRDAPELSLGYQHEREEYGAGYDGSVRVGIRVPFATAGRNAPRITSARAELVEAEATAARVFERITAELETERHALEQARWVESLAQERLRLAQDSKERYAKAFRLGETDLLTRLRTESEFFEAELSLLQARIELGRAISRFNQAMGILP